VVLNERGFLFFDATKLDEAPKQIESSVEYFGLAMGGGSRGRGGAKLNRVFAPANYVAQPAPKG